MPKRKTFGQVAYEGYSASLWGQTHPPEHIPAWESLPSDVRNAWQAVEEALSRSNADEPSDGAGSDDDANNLEPKSEEPSDGAGSDDDANNLEPKSEA